MGWKGTLRSLQAAARRADREAQRRQRELERQRAQIAKMEALARATYEVQVYENYIDVLLSVHKECSNTWNWEEIRSASPPVEPVKSHERESSAQQKLDRFEPGFFDRLFGRTESKRAKLSKAVEDARRKDEGEYKEALQTYRQEYAGWEEARDLARRILTGDLEAYEETIRETDPFSDISELGSSISCRAANSRLVEAALRVKAEDVVPSETKSLLKSGKVSVKKMPKTKYFELYQDYVCGCVLRVARELMALLPIEMVIVTAWARLLNAQTGHMEDHPIVTVTIPRDTLERLNCDLIDPSDSMANFVHRMVFKKTKGFSAVQALTPGDLAQ